MRVLHFYPDSFDGVQTIMWTHIALRRSGATWQVFINGVAQSQTGSDGATFTFAFGSCPFHIGVDADIGCTGALTEPGTRNIHWGERGGWSG
jgi:hypothetical protein